LAACDGALAYALNNTALLNPVDTAEHNGIANEYAATDLLEKAARPAEKFASAISRARAAEKAMFTR
jgi:hypothetical protein